MLIQRYVLTELTRYFLFIFICLSALVLVGFSIQQMMKFGGVGVEVLVQLLPYMLGYVISYSIPVSLLLACVIVYRHMARENEITAARAAGISRVRLARPALLLALILTLLLVWVHQDLKPESHYTRQHVNVRELSNILMTATHGQQTFPVGDTMFRYESIRDGYLQDVHVIEMHESGAPARWFVADRGQFLQIPTLDNPTLRFELQNVVVVNWEDPENRVHQRGYTREGEPLVISRDMQEELGVAERQLDDMTLSHIHQVAGTIDGGRPTPPRMRSYTDHRLATEVYRRYAAALAPLALIFLGIPLAMISRDGSRVRGMALGIVPALILFYPAIITAEHLTLAYALPPVCLVFLPHLGFAIAGIYIMRMKSE